MHFSTYSRVVVPELSFLSSPPLGCGDVKSIRLATDKNTKAFRGFGHITFRKPDAIDRAIALHGVTLKGRELTVAPAEPKGTNNFLNWGDFTHAPLLLPVITNAWIGSCREK